MARHKLLFGAMAGIVLLGTSGLATALVAAPASLLSDPSRPEADRIRDADRKPAELIAFARVRPGTRVAELAPGGGYFTRILAKAVGPKGRVYALSTRPSPTLEEYAKSAGNVTFVQIQPGTVSAPEPVDIVWTTLNYHDFKNAKVGEVDAAAATNQAAFRALKPGGLYLIVDHEAARGAGASQTSTLHRVESALVKQEVERAGFKLDAESDLLRHPADDHSLKVVESGIRGKTDQFVLRFRKPRG
jgi:predicted methyltransferase